MSNQELGALHGLKILDLTRVLAGPFCTMLLADLGAEVIKIEVPQGGDDTRGYPPFLADGFSAYYGNINRNKKSLALNLKLEAGRETFLRLAQKADVVIENYKPGTMDKLGIGYAVLRQDNPGLIFASISGYGQTGRYRDLPGYDIIAQALGGLMSVSGWPDSPPTRSGTALGDVLAGLNCCVGILAALQHRQRTGEGQCLDVALVDSVVSAMETIMQIYLVEGRVPERIGNRYEFIAPYDSFRTRDGWVVIACGNDAVWQRFCRAMGRDDLLGQAEYAQNASRVAHHQALKAEVEAWSGGRSLAEVVACLQAAQVPCAPIQNVEQIVRDPHIAGDRQMFVPMSTPSGLPMTGVATPLKLSATQPTVRQGPPALGQHTAEILTAELGLSPELIQQYVEQGVLGI